MSRHTLARVASIDQSPTPAAPPKRRRAQELARVMLLNPRTIGALHCAHQLGHALQCRLDGTTLVVEVVR